MRILTPALPSRRSVEYHPPPYLPSLTEFGGADSGRSFLLVKGRLVSKESGVMRQIMLQRLHHLFLVIYLERLHYH